MAQPMKLETQLPQMDDPPVEAAATQGSPAVFWGIIALAIFALISQSSPDLGFDVSLVGEHLQQAVLHWWPMVVIVMGLAYFSAKIPDGKLKQYSSFIAQSDIFAAALISLLAHYVVFVEQPEPLLEAMVLRLAVAVGILTLARQVSKGDLSD